MTLCEQKTNSASKEKKILRKQRRFQHMLIADAGLEPVNNPEKNVAVCNAGLATGLDEATLLSICSEFGQVERIALLPGKSYCFVVFSGIEAAVRAFDNMHASANLAQDGKPLYLSYVQNVPEDEGTPQTDLPEGLSLHENFVTESEEAALLKCINWEDNSDIASSLKNRKVKHYGYEFIYGRNNIDLQNPLKEVIPAECDMLWTRLEKINKEWNQPPNQLTVNQYSPGHGIPSHIDTHSAFLSPILSLSLGSAVIMEFRCKQKRCNVLLPPRSLLIMDGASRYEWSHGIAPRTYDLVEGHAKPRSQRTSFTFRWVCPDATCHCSFPQQCDTFNQGKMTLHPQIDTLAPLIEQHHVHQVYDKIASHFSETRSKIWPSVQNFVGSLTEGTVLVDIGCGNGKNLRLRKDLIQIGVEYNKALATVAMWGDNADNCVSKEQAFNIDVVQANCLYLPLRSDSADAVISIAVFHHLVTEERRFKAIKETARILKVGGKALISVWAKDQARGDDKTSYLKQSRKNRKPSKATDNPNNSLTNEYVTEELKDSKGDKINVNLPVHVNRTQFQHQDLLVPWKLKGSSANASKCEKEVESNTYMRYYHVFEEGELQELCKLLPNVKILDSFYEQGNWCVVFEKI